MPIHLPPISRRRFLQASSAAFAALAVDRLADAAEGNNAQLDPHRVALLSDTHVAADAARVVNEINVADHLRRACDDVLRLQPRPAHALINGDFALKDGQSGDYATAVKL